MRARVSFTVEDLRALDRGLNKLLVVEAVMLTRGWDKSVNPEIRAMHEAAERTQHELLETQRKLVRAASRLGVAL